MNESYCLFSLWPGFNSQPRRSISREFSLADRTLPTRPEPAWQKMAQSSLTIDIYWASTLGVTHSCGTCDVRHVTIITCIRHH